MNRVTFLEHQMNRDDLTDAEFDAFNRELNEIYFKRELAKKTRVEELKQLQDQKELDSILSLTEEEVDKMYEETCTRYQDVNGMSFRDWYAQSLTYYTIDDKFNVHAKARSENTVEIVPNLSMAQAKLTILTRIKYKFYDHAVRGCDFAWE